MMTLKLIRPWKIDDQMKFIACMVVNQFTGLTLSLCLTALAAAVILTGPSVELYLSHLVSPVLLLID